MKLKPVHKLIKGEIVRIDEQLREVISVKRAKHSSYIRILFSDGKQTLLPPRYELETTGLKFRG